MKIIQCQQGTAGWWRARQGLPSGSGFSNIITPLGTAKKGKAVDGYIAELIAQPVWVKNNVEEDDNFPVTSAGTAAMQRGKDLEPEARDYYQKLRDVTVSEVGFCLADNGRYGVSPDALIYDDDFQLCGGVEIKCPSEKTHYQYLMAGRIPDEYVAQVNGCLLVTGVAWWDFVSYCPGFEAQLIVRVHRESNEYLAKLESAINAFCDKLDQARANFQQLTKGAA